MFANDTNITVSGCTFAELKQATNSELTNLYNWLKPNKGDWVEACQADRRVRRSNPPLLMFYG